MTEQQKEWLADHPNYSHVKPVVVSAIGWTDRGYLFANGQFSADDGKTFFTNLKGAMQVGRHHQVM